jgi:hypothetical protein
MDHWALVELHEDFILWKKAHTFVDRTKHRRVKHHLLMGGERSLNEIFNLAGMLDAAGNKDRETP